LFTGLATWAGRASVALEPGDTILAAWTGRAGRAFGTNGTGGTACPSITFGTGATGQAAVTLGTFCASRPRRALQLIECLLQNPKAGSQLGNLVA